MTGETPKTDTPATMASNDVPHEKPADSEATAPSIKPIPSAQEQNDTKTCPYCMERVKREATKCSHCELPQKSGHLKQPSCMRH